MIENFQKMSLQAQSVATPISKLPDEVFVQVLSHFSVFELASFERVSRSWKKTIRSHQILWRDDGFEKRSQDVCAPKHVKKFRIMLQRGGGKLDRLFLPICLASNSHTRVKKILKILSSTEVQELWIVVRGDFTSSKESNYIRQAKLSKEYFEAVVKTVLESVIQCGNLSSLRLVCTECVTVDMSKCGDSAKWPFSSCRLEKLALQNIRYDSLFPNKDLYKVVSGTKEMEVCFEGIGSYLRDVDVWPLISAAKDALVLCRTSYPQKVVETINAPRHLSFPKLEVLYINIQDARWALGNPYPTLTRYMLNCPNLKELYTFATIPSPMLEHLLSNKLEKLGIAAFPEAANPKKALINKLQSCTKVQTLFITGTDSKDLKELYTSKVFKKMPLKEITCFYFDVEKLDIVKNIIQDRQRSGEQLSTIKKATFTTLLGLPQDVEWFSKNVEEVKCSGMLSEVTRSFVPLYQKGLYDFEVGGAGVPLFGN